jgi:hypothetical protein
MCYFNCDVYLFDLQALKFATLISSKTWGSQAKNSQAVGVGSSLSISYHVVGKKTQSAFREEQGWTHICSSADYA